MKRIIFDCERMKYKDTGLYHYCLNLGLHLQKAVSEEQKEEIVFYVPASGVGLFGKEALYIQQKSLHKYLMPSFPSYDIWHITFQGTHYIPPRHQKGKIVLTIHDLNYLYDESKSEAKKRKFISDLQKLIKRSHAIVCISDYCKNDILTHCHIGHTPLYTIYNGRNRMQPAQLESSSYHPQKPYLFFVGTINPKKNCHTLLPLLVDNDMDLLLAGKYENKDYVDAIQQEMDRLGIADRVHLLGSVSEAEKAWYYENCQAFLFPSLSEGFGLPVIEAMHYGKPVFLSDRTALPEIGGDAAFYFTDFTPASMQQVFREGMLYYQTHQQTMAAHIRARAALFDWQKAALAYLNVYRTL